MIYLFSNINKVWNNNFMHNDHCDVSGEVVKSESDGVSRARLGTDVLQDGSLEDDDSAARTGNAVILCVKLLYFVSF